MSVVDGGIAVARREIDVWGVDLAPAGHDLRTAEQCLDYKEICRASRLGDGRDRRRFVISHAALRHILAGYLGSAPAEVRIEQTPLGKPMLAGAKGEDLSFSLSHAGDLAAVAVSRGGSLGIDIEEVVDRAGLDTVARLWFTEQEHRRYMRLPPRERLRAFHCCWVGKEAVAKAVGDGLSLDFTSFAAQFRPEPPATVKLPRGEIVQLMTFEPRSGFVGAVAAMDGDITVRERWWSAASQSEIAIAAGQDAALGKETYA